MFLSPQNNFSDPVGYILSLSDSQSHGPYMATLMTCDGHHGVAACS